MFKVGDTVALRVNIPIRGTDLIAAYAGDVGVITTIININNTGGVACGVYFSYLGYAVLVDPYGLQLVSDEYALP